MAAWLAAYHWLVTNGLWRSVIGWSVGGTLGYLLGRAPWHKHRQSQLKIEDALDTDTPGGLTVIKDMLKEQQKHPQQQQGSHK